MSREILNKMYDLVLELEAKSHLIPAVHVQMAADALADQMQMPAE